jgi:hypothetical protein
MFDTPQTDVRAIAIFTTSHDGKAIDLGAIGMDAEGIAVPLPQEDALNKSPGLAGFLQEIAQPSKNAPPLLALEEDTAARINADRLEKQPCIIDLAPESLAALLRQLNAAQLHEALRTGGPVEVRHRGKRHVLIPVTGPGEVEAQGAPLKMGSLKELASIAPAKAAEAPALSRNPLAPGAFRGVATNVPAERLPATAVMQWAVRAQDARAAFAPVQIVVGRPASGEGVLLWRNHRNLQFMTHRLRGHLHAEWSARGENRPVEDVLRDLQEVHRATLTVNGEVVRRLASHPSKAVAATLERLNLWPLFESPDCGK